MALFESTSKQLVKDTGRSSLHPIVDLNSASQCKIMCIIEKKKSRWFWRPTKYLPTPFTLNELMTKPIDVSKKIKTSEFVSNYSNQPTLHVSGKLGGKIAKELGIDVSTADSFVVKMDLGSINKSEIRWQDLNDALKDQTLKLDHEFVQAILNCRRRSLCIVFETLNTTKDTNIQSDIQVEGDAVASTDIISKASVNISGSIKDTHHHSFDIPNGTVMAYGCYGLKLLEGLGLIELDVDKKLKDVVTDATDGKPPDAFSMDQPDGPDTALTSAFNALMKSPHKGDIIKCFREILATPEYCHVIEQLLDNVCDYFDKEKVKSYSLDEVKSLFGSCNSWERLLTILGITFDSKKGGKMIYPEDDKKDVVLSCCGLATSLHGLTNLQNIALKDVTPEYCDQLLYLIRNAICGKNTPADDPRLKRIYTHSSNPGKSFLLALGFQLTKQNGKDILALPPDLECPLEDAYVAVFVMAS
ncbi:uncharacterized protein LOC110248344 [Exaiptasia diaphana]|uniref:Gasdermin pore forming domain-containing protein n=1 Tax=Exaiptasia diaphana TaxID=2652724 RepID=A0A913XVL6_EXADI|nr:uncharacterized protein LOC110248344 [Exaiptasia diaphana]KXJ08722.1 Pejvakin [Exaiptasia diaphana]